VEKFIVRLRECFLPDNYWFILTLFYGTPLSLHAVMERKNDDLRHVLEGTLRPTYGIPHDCCTYSL